MTQGHSKKMYENITPFDERIIKAFRISYHHQIKPTAIKLTLIMLVVSILIFSLGFQVFAIVALSFTALIPILLHIIVPIYIIKKEAKNPAYKEPFLQGLIQTYIFDEDNIKITTNKRDQSLGPLIVEYQDINKVIKFKGFLIFYTSQNVAHTLDEQGMIKGQIEDLYKHLKDVIKQNKPSKPM